MPSATIHFGSHKHKENIKQSLVDNIFKAIESPLLYQLRIGYEVWDTIKCTNNIWGASGTTMSCTDFYAVGTSHKMEDKGWKVVSVDKDVMQQDYIVMCEQELNVGIIGPNEEHPDPAGNSIEIEPITDFKSVPGQFNVAGEWVDDVVTLPARTEREKLFHELAKGVTS